MGRKSGRGKDTKDGDKQEGIRERNGLGVCTTSEIRKSVFLGLIYLAVSVTEHGYSIWKQKYLNSVYVSNMKCRKNRYGEPYVTSMS